MKEEIKKKWEKLTEKNFCEYIKSMLQQYKLVIFAQGKSIKYWVFYHIE